MDANTAPLPPAVPLKRLAVLVGDVAYEKLWELQSKLSGAAPADRTDALRAWTHRSMSLLTQLYACIACVDSAGATGLSFSGISSAALAGVRASDAVAGAVTTLAECKRHMHVRAKPAYDVSGALVVCGVEREPPRRGIGGTLAAFRSSGRGGAGAPSTAAVISHVSSVAGTAELRGRVAHAARLAAASSDGGGAGGAPEAALREHLEAAGVLQGGRLQVRPYDRAKARRRIHRAIVERLPLCTAAARHLSPRLCVRLDRGEEGGGAVELSVPEEFSATLTLLGYGLREPWAVVSVRLARGGDAGAAHASAPSSAYAAAQDAAVAEALQRALQADAEAARAAADNLVSVFDGAFCVTHRICHAAWSAVSLQARAVAAGALASAAAPPSTVTSLVPRALFSSADGLPALAFRRRLSRWHPGSVSLLYYPRSHSLLLGLWHAAALPAADAELERSLALIEQGDCDLNSGPQQLQVTPAPRCPSLSCATGDAACLARRLGGGGKGAPFVPRFSLSLDVAGGSGGVGGGGIGASDPIVASLDAFLTAAAAAAAVAAAAAAAAAKAAMDARCVKRQQAVPLVYNAEGDALASAAEVAPAAAAVPTVLVVDEWGLAVPLGPGLLQQQRGAPLLTPGLRAALSLVPSGHVGGGGGGAARVGPTELASALRRTAAAGAAGGASTARVLSDAVGTAGGAAAQREDASGVVVRATGELVVRRSADGSARARLEKAPVLANQRLGARGSTDPAGAAAAASAPRALAVGAGGGVAASTPVEAISGATVALPPLLASCAAALASLQQPAHASASLVLAPAGAPPLPPLLAGGGALQDPVARFSVAAAESPPGAPAPSASSGGSLELAIASVLSADVLGSAPVAPPQATHAHAGAAGAAAAVEQSELVEQDGLSVGPPEDTDPESVLRACAYRPQAAAFWPSPREPIVGAAPTAAAPPPAAAAAVLGCLCVGEITFLPSPSVPAAAVAAVAPGQSGDAARARRPPHLETGVLVRSLPPPAVSWDAPTLSCGTDASALPRLWQRLALQRSSAIARVAAAVVAARPDLQAALPENSALRLGVLPAADADLAPFAAGEGEADEGLQICIALPAASARAGHPLLLRVWVDPVSAAVRLVLAADTAPADPTRGSAPGRKRLCADAAPLCTLALECAHHTRARFADRLAAVAHAIAAADRSGRAALRESLQSFARARRHGASSAATGVSEVAGGGPAADAVLPGTRPPPRRGSIDGAESVASSSTVRGSVRGSTMPPSQREAAAAATAIAAASAHVGRPGLLTPLAIGMDVFRSAMADGAGADARSPYEDLRRRIEQPQGGGGRAGSDLVVQEVRLERALGSSRKEHTPASCPPL